MKDRSFELAGMVSHLLREVIHNAALSNTKDNAAFTRLSFKVSEGANRYLKKSRCILFGAVFCHRLRIPIYARSMRLLKIAKYALKPKQSFSMPELLAIEALNLYAVFLKDTQRSSKTQVELVGVMAKRKAFTHFVEAIESEMVNRGIPLSFNGGDVSLSPIPVDQYITGDEVFFVSENNTTSGIVKRVLKTGFKVQLMNNEIMTIPRASIV